MGTYDAGTLFKLSPRPSMSGKDHSCRAVRARNIETGAVQAIRNFCV